MSFINVVYKEDSDYRYHKNLLLNTLLVEIGSITTVSNKGKKNYRVSLSTTTHQFYFSSDEDAIREYSNKKEALETLRNLLKKD